MNELPLIDPSWDDELARELVRLAQGLPGDAGEAGRRLRRFTPGQRARAADVLRKMGLDLESE